VHFVTGFVCYHRHSGEGRNPRKTQAGRALQPFHAPRVQPAWILAFVRITTKMLFLHRVGMENKFTLSKTAIDLNLAAHLFDFSFIFSRSRKLSPK